MRTILLSIAALSLASCATVTTQVDQVKCSTFVPKAWAEKIAGEPLPDLTFLDDLYSSPDKDKQILARELEKREWMKWGTGNAFRLSIAQSRSDDTMEIVRNCENNVQAAIKKINKKWYEFWK
jgi:hypothetical protein